MRLKLSPHVDYFSCQNYEHQAGKDRLFFLRGVEGRFRPCFTLFSALPDDGGVEKRKEEKCFLAVYASGFVFPCPIAAVLTKARVGSQRQVLGRPSSLCNLLMVAHLLGANARPEVNSISAAS